MKSRKFRSIGLAGLAIVALILGALTLSGKVYAGQSLADTPTGVNGDGGCGP